MQDNKLIKALVLNAQLGNNSAFEQLYQITIEPIYVLILRLTGDTSSAEILTKKTYVNAGQKISQKDEFISILSWLKKIAIETVLADKSIEKKSAGTLDPKILGDNPLERYIQDLEFRNRLIYILHDIENFSFEEISKLSGISDNEIKSLLVNTRENLINLTEE
jgi:DNA-directed RNA polymerase specialized sigma24 family protein